jgi:glycosyltransferase involved in cell wall biosynthesis
MIHLVIRLPLPYQRTLCQTLSDAYGGAFVAWFAERQHKEFPFRSGGEPRFAHHYLSETGYWKLFKALKADPEAVVILGGWSSPMTNRTLIMTTLLRIPVFVWADHPHPRKRSWVAARSRELYLRTLARLVSGFLACGSPTVEHLASLGIERGKLTNFPYWVELPLEWSVPKRCLDEESARRPLRLLAIGRLVPVKQFEVAIEAVALANSAAGRQLAELLIVGDGPERPMLEALAQSKGCAKGCEESISFSGWLETDEVYKELRKADAFIITSQFEPYGVVVLEAMAAGRPVLASQAVVAARDRDEATGAIYLHRTGDIRVLAEQIAMLASDHQELRKASIASRATGKKWPQERSVTIIDEIMKKTKRGRMLSTHKYQATDGNPLEDKNVDLVRSQVARSTIG